MVYLIFKVIVKKKERENPAGFLKMENKNTWANY
jgi:hypothetical protein